MSEPGLATLADAMHYLKLSFAKRLRSESAAEESFWQKRYYDRNVRDEDEFKIKLRYLHREPGQARVGSRARRLEVEQLSALRVS
jgi:hypothetical protein